VSVIVVFKNKLLIVITR